NLGGASSWQTWNGTGWQQLSWPPQCHELPGLESQTTQANAGSVSYSTYLSAFVAIVSGGPTQLAYSTSTDLLNWSAPQRIMTFRGGGVSGFDQVNGLTLLYPSLLDPTDPSPNFERMNQQPYLYMVYFKPNGDRDIVRQQIRFTTLN